MRLGRFGRSRPHGTHRSPQARPADAEPSVYDCVVIGAGQAGLSASYHLNRRDITHVVLDANSRPGGAWQHRWRSLTMNDVHGVADLPNMSMPEGAGEDSARGSVSEYFGVYELTNALPVRRPVKVRHVRRDGPLLRVETESQSFWTRTLINATGTWGQPFIPFYRGADQFAGRQLHTVDYDGPGAFRGQHVVVVGGGASAVQILGELAGVATTVWVTRRPPQWREEPFGEIERRAAVSKVAERVREGFAPPSIVSVTGLVRRPQEERARALGAYERQPMFTEIESHRVRWPDGRYAPADVIIWATGFRPAIGHLSKLQLRDANGGIRVDDTTAVADPRIHLVGYGPSASTIGANRAGQTAAREVDKLLSTSHRQVRTD